MFKFLAGNKGSFSILSGRETIFSSKYRWIFHLKEKKIILMTDIEHTLWVVYYSPERFLSCTFQNNVEHVSLMTDLNGFFVVGKDGTTSFYSISDIMLHMFKQSKKRLKSKYLIQLHDKSLLHYKCSG